MIEIPSDLNAVLDAAWQAARDIPGFLTEAEARFLGMAAACAPRGGEVLEIGSFKGKSTVMLAKVAERYGHGQITAIDPHNFNSPELADHRKAPGASSFDEFLSNLDATNVRDRVEVQRAFSGDVAAAWNRPIRFLWIDGDHGYAGVKADFDGFARRVIPGGIVAFHDALHEFSGPIRVLSKMFWDRTGMAQRALLVRLRGHSSGRRMAARFAMHALRLHGVRAA